MATVANSCRQFQYYIWAQKTTSIKPIFAIKNTCTGHITWYTIFELVQTKTILYQLPPEDIFMLGYWLSEAGIRLEMAGIKNAEKLALES